MSTNPPDDSQTPAISALTALIRPLARLAMAGGVPYTAVEDIVKEAFIESARQTLQGSGLPEHRQVSRISASTGLPRREVTRLTQPKPSATPPATRSWPSEVFTRWATDPLYRDPEGQVMPLKRQGPPPSFESLSRSITQNIHPRSLLEALCHLGVADLDPADDTVRLTSTTFVPQNDRSAMLGFLGDNVGDHLEGAVHNLLSDGSRPHQDQAVFADELSEQSLDTIRAFIETQWRQLVHEAVPLLERCIEQDVATGRVQDQRVRIGLYSYEHTMNPPTSGPLPTNTTRSREID
jgi:Family of unknown function (DUF6502)